MPRNIILSSFNVWGIPFASPHVLSRGRRTVGPAFHKAFRKEVDDTCTSAKDEPLAIAVFQEAWAFRCGPALPLVLLAGYLEPIPIIGSHILNTVALVAALVFGILFPFKYFVWDGFKRPFLNDVTPYAVGLAGTAGADCRRTLLDSGLLVLSNHKPSSSGFVMFPMGAGEDKLAAKGILWCNFDHLDTVVIATHLQARAPDTKHLQIEYLAKFIETWKQKVGLVLLAGDFNVDRFHKNNLEDMLAMRFVSAKAATWPTPGTWVKVTSWLGVGNKCIDHVLIGGKAADKLRVVDAKIVNPDTKGRTGSDHLMSVVRLAD